MSITKEAAKAQLGRLSGLAYKPDSEDAWRELRDTLATLSRSEDEGAAIISAWLGNTEPDEHGRPKGRTFPTPADLKTTAYAVREQAKQSASPDGCRECSGTGYVHLEAKTFNRATQSVEATDAVRYCDCPKGSWMAQKARERQAGAA